MKVIILVGPTGSGKSEIALKLAKKNRCEIVNADSRQMYRGLDIGAAKPSLDDRKIVPHHLYDILDADDAMSAGEFSRRADKIISEILGRGAQPLIVGGTGFYVRALTEGLSEIGSVKPEVAARLKKTLKQKGLPFLWKMLSRVDPKIVLKIQQSDKQRILRALEVYFSTGKPLSSYFEKQAPPTKYEFLKIGITLERKILYERIDARVDAMLENGWVDEVRALLNRGFISECRAFEAIGYRRIARYILEGGDFEIIVNEIKKEHRNYAKRQMTWFKKEKNVKWFDAEERDSATERIFSYCSARSP